MIGPTIIWTSFVTITRCDNLKDNPAPEAGNLGQLNAMLRTVLGNKLYAAEGFRRWPGLSTLTNKIVLVLSGDRTTRTAYLFDEGQDPAIAVSENFRVVTLHNDGGERLWYWTGKSADLGGSVTWLHHGRYDTGRNPSVIFVDNQWVVEVHRSHTRDRLFGAVGRYQSDGTITWYPERALFDGRRSHLSLDGDGRIRLRFENTSGGISVAFGERQGFRVVFDEPNVTNDELGDPSTSRGVSVQNSSRVADSDRALAYRTAASGSFARALRTTDARVPVGDTDFQDRRRVCEFSSAHDQVRL